MLPHSAARRGGTAAALVAVSGPCTPDNGRSMMNVTSLARRSMRALAPIAVSLPMLGAGVCVALAQGEVNIYSYREPQLIDPLLKAFTDKTGIKANVVFASAGP